MLDAQGYVAECSSENIFIIRDGVILTPHDAAILEGITRDAVMVLAVQWRFQADARRLCAVLQLSSLYLKHARFVRHWLCEPAIGAPHERVARAAVAALALLVVCNQS